MRLLYRSAALLSALLLSSAVVAPLAASPARAATENPPGTTPVIEVPGTPYAAHATETAKGTTSPAKGQTGRAETQSIQGASGLSRSGDIKVTLVTVQLADTSAAQVNAISLDAARNSISSASNYWKAMSNDRLSMSVASVRTGVRSSATSGQSYSDIAATVTRELGWVPSPYTALVVFVPSATLSWGALGFGASADGTSGRILMPKPSGFTNNVVAHEFGHVLGLMHADSLQCGSGIPDVGSNSAGGFADSSCSIREYGDTTDLMGAAQYNLPAISSSFWDRGGFGRGDEILNAGTASGNKSYTLKAWAGNDAQRAVKFTDPKSGEVYYLELRLPVGYDANTAVGGNRGVKIVQSGGSTSASSLILMPSTRPFSGYYAPNQTWQAGQTFTTHSGTKVTVDYINGTSAGVTIRTTPSDLPFREAAARNRVMGAATSGVADGLKDGGAYQMYQGGVIVWSPATGAHVSRGAIRSAYQDACFERGVLGYPTTDEIGGLKGGGVYQMYQGGAIVWSPGSGAHVSTGAIRSAYQDSGFENGVLGYPTTDQISGLKDGGVYQMYQGGAIVWSPATGAFVSSGGIRGAYQKSGFENGVLGYPTTNETKGLKSGGAFQNYQGGAVIWSPATGAHVTTGAIRHLWTMHGLQNGKLGYPTSDEYTAGGDVAQDFQGGKIVYSRWTGATVVWPR